MERENVAFTCSVELDQRDLKSSTEKVNVACQSEAEEPIDLETIHH